MQGGETRDLASMLAGGKRLEIEHALYIITRCARALARADQRGVIAPNRILISNTGDVTLDEHDPTQSDIDVLREQFSYMSPEALNAPMKWRHTETRVYETKRGTSMEISSWGPIDLPPIDWERAAVFSLGAILWEMLAGRPHFKGANESETLALVRVADTRPLPEAPPELEAIVRKALARNVEERYQTGGELSAALEGYLVTLALN